MLAQIRKMRRGFAAGVLLMASVSLISCASNKTEALVDDPDSKHEGMIPWNRQEKWEAQGQYAGMTDRR